MGKLNNYFEALEREHVMFQEITCEQCGACPKGITLVAGSVVCQAHFNEHRDLIRRFSEIPDDGYITMREKNWSRTEAMIEALARVEDLK